VQADRPPPPVGRKKQYSPYNFYEKNTLDIKMSKKYLGTSKKFWAQQ
jgi:hypothetical protein